MGPGHIASGARPFADDCSRTVGQRKLRTILPTPKTVDSGSRSDFADLLAIVLVCLCARSLACPFAYLPSWFPTCCRRWQTAVYYFKSDYSVHTHFQSQIRSIYFITSYCNHCLWHVCVLDPLPWTRALMRKALDERGFRGPVTAVATRKINATGCVPPVRPAEPPVRRVPTTPTPRNAGFQRATCVAWRSSGRCPSAISKDLKIPC